MNAQRWSEIQASFDNLVELSPTDRASQLESMASDDPELHEALQSLLRADAAATRDLAPIPSALLQTAGANSDPLGLAGRTISHFDVREALGAGGMGVVYRANDQRLRRAVALKFLLPHYNLDASAKNRFLREAKAAGALDHPNLCALHEVGTTDEGWLFLAMPLYEGETLRERLTRDGPMKTRDALNIARQITEGLRAAHTAGIVHRDLKPGNVMLLRDDTLRILDFGLAKARDQTATETGSAFGTVSYMSPEQITGVKVDGRADLWALGVVLYEMLTGIKPFKGDEEVAIAHAILHDQPVLPSTHRRDLSAALEGLVLRLLQKDPTKRYADAHALLRDLERVGALTTGRVDQLRTSWRRTSRRVADRVRPISAQILIAVTVVAVATATYLVSRAVREPASRDVVAAPTLHRSIAVLPFRNVGRDSATAPFGDGIADELTTTLGKIDELNVMARSSAFTLAHKGLQPLEIGHQLNVQYVLGGSLEIAANRRHVNANLIDVSNGKKVWSQDFQSDALNRDGFAVEDSITRSIVHQIVPGVSPLTLASAVRRQTENQEAHDLYRQGRFFFEKRDSASFKLAQKYFRDAIRADTSYALAYSGLADAYSHQAIFGYAPRAVNYPLARKYAALALARDSTLVEVHTSLAFLALFYDWNWPAAAREFEIAFRLKDNYAPAHLFHAWYMMAVDSTETGIAESQRAIDIEPYSALNNARLLSFLYLAGHYQETIDRGRKSFERDSTFPSVRLELARALVEVGRCSEALAVLGKGPDPLAGVLLGVRGYTYAKCNRRAKALAQLKYVQRLSKGGTYGAHYALAVIESGLGDKEQEIAELEKGYTEHAWPMYLIKLDPPFANIRTDPRFIALVRKVGLAPLS